MYEFSIVNILLGWCCIDVVVRILRLGRYFACANVWREWSHICIKSRVCSFSLWQWKMKWLAGHILITRNLGQIEMCFCAVCLVLILVLFIRVCFHRHEHVTRRFCLFCLFASNECNWFDSLILFTGVYVNLFDCLLVCFIVWLTVCVISRAVHFSSLHFQLSLKWGLFFLFVFISFFRHRIFVYAFALQVCLDTFYRIWAWVHFS